MYVFYDFETSGANVAFDQPLQFAAILTDNNFQEKKSIDIRCRLSPHILPAPWAMQVTGLTPEILTCKDLPTVFEFSREVQRVVHEWSPAIWIGYNNLGFDELIMRHLFYQNLQPEIYATQTYGNTRLDVLSLVYATYALQNPILKWPQKANGTTTFKLDQLAPFNGFNEHNAHDALGDVRATIFVAKLIRDRCPAIWEDCIKSTNKTFVNSLISSDEPMSMVFRFGQAPPKLYNVMYCGRSEVDRNKVAVIDLNEFSGQDSLNSYSTEQVEKFFSKSPKVLRSFRVNSSPIIKVTENPEIEIQEKASLVLSSFDFKNKVCSFLTSEYAETEKASQVELQIYDGFVSSLDKQILEGVGPLTWIERKNIFAKLSDSRLRKLSKRLLLFESPQLLAYDQREKSFRAINERWSIDSKVNVGWTTYEKVKKQLVDLTDLGYFSEQKKKDFEVFYSSREQALKDTIGL